MQRRFWLSGLMLVVGVSLLMAAGFASPASSSPQAAAKNGGTLRVIRRSPFDYVDPSRAYFSHTWGMEFATGCKLYNWGDTNKTLRPEVATAMPKISNSGRVYTFTIRKGYRFANDGKAVTAANFAWALNRALLWRPYTPAADFLTDSSATEIVGAADVVADKTTRASGIQVKGNKLIVRLVRPSPVFVTQLTMPFYMAMPTNWPITKIDESQMNLVGNTCGPYHMTSSDRTSFAVLSRNPNYKGPRPHHLASIRWTMGVSPDSQQLQVEKNQQDIGGFPPANTAALVRKYGLYGKAKYGRFLQKTQAVTWYLALNTQAKAFKNNVPLRQAVNFAINRNALTQQVGAGAASPTDQILPPDGMPGFKDWKIYPFKPNVAKAKKLANGHLRDKSIIFYTYQDDPGPASAQIVQANLAPLGLNTDIKVFERTVQEEKVQHKGEPFDITLAGWGSDYPDPYDFINILLSGKNIHETGNINTSYFDNAQWNKRMDQSAALPLGPKRYTSYANLDRDLVQGPAPVAPMYNSNAQALLSNRVKTLGYQPVYGVVSYTATELK